MSGLGANYKALQANWASDAAYFNSIGATTIRPNLASLPVGWAPPGTLSQGSYEYWRNCASYFASQGFFVTWGPACLSTATSALSMSATQWTQYHDAVVADAAYMQSQGIALGAYELGNELEPKADGTTLTVAQLIANLRQLALDVKAVYTLSPITYSLYDTNGITYDLWISGGLGGLDMLGLHPYANLANSGRALTDGGFTPLGKMMNAFGPSKLYISEYGLDSSNTNLLLFTKALETSAMRYYRAWLANLGFSNRMVYSFVGYLNADNQFAMKDIDFSYEPMWDVQIQEGKRTQNITVNELP